MGDSLATMNENTWRSTGDDVGAPPQLRPTREEDTPGLDVVTMPPKLAAALAKAQAAVNTATRDGRNEHAGRYASRESIAATAKLALGSAGLSFFAEDTRDVGGVIHVRYVIAHESGEAMRIRSEIPTGSGGRMSPEQRRGAAESYGYKYALLGILNIPRSDEDPDASTQAEKPKPSPKPRTPRKPSEKSERVRAEFDSLRRTVSDDEFGEIVGQDATWSPSNLKEAQEAIKELRENARRLEKLHALLRGHDWYFRMSEDRGVYARGDKSERSFRTAMSLLPKSQAQAAYDEHAPKSKTQPAEEKGAS